MTVIAPFHIAFPVDDLAAARRFNGGLLAGQVGEQATMVFHDPAGNALEFKSFGDRGQSFAK